MMKHLFLSLALVAMTAAVSQVQAQSLVNTNWKAFVGEPVNDTLVLHIKTDSSFVTNHLGTVVVRSLCKVWSDTLSLADVDGEYACPNMTGKYKFAQNEGMLTFTLIEDPCDGRAGALSAMKWKKAPDSSAK